MAGLYTAVEHTKYQWDTGHMITGSLTDALPCFIATLR